MGVCSPIVSAAQWLQGNSPQHRFARDGEFQLLLMTAPLPHADRAVSSGSAVAPPPLPCGCCVLLLPHHRHGVHRRRVGPQQGGVGLGGEVQQAQRTALGTHCHLKAIRRQPNPCQAWGGCGEEERRYR